MSNKTFKTFLDKMGGTDASNYIGRDGELFYDPNTTTLRISDAVTPGEIVMFTRTLNTSEILNTEAYLKYHWAL